MDGGREGWLDGWMKYSKALWDSEKEEITSIVGDERGLQGKRGVLF